MTTVELLAEHLQRHGGEAATVSSEDYELRVVAGRPGSVCFTLRWQTAPESFVVLAEGFSLDNELIFDQCALSPDAVERIIRRLVGAPRLVVIGGSEAVVDAPGNLVADA